MKRVVCTLWECVRVQMEDEWKKIWEIETCVWVYECHCDFVLLISGCIQLLFISILSHFVSGGLWLVSKETTQKEKKCCEYCLLCFSVGLPTHSLLLCASMCLKGVFNISYRLNQLFLFQTAIENRKLKFKLCITFDDNQNIKKENKRNIWFDLI